jgi:formylglycine-generating enzyme required for sulfatase activity
MTRRTPLALLALALAASCTDSAPINIPDVEVCLARRDGQRYCIDVFEASRRDATKNTPGTDTKSAPRSLAERLPWTDLTWDNARGACTLRSHRLCAFDEWIDACDGVVGDGGTKYTFGNTASSTTCNVTGTMAVPTGSMLKCKSSVGTYDQSGNVWEWTGNTDSEAIARGGGWDSDVTYMCTSDSMNAFSPNGTYPIVGFRCCRDE